MIINNQSSYYLYSGTVGWSGNKGLEAFYPAGLPDEWKLAYYNTQFRCAYLTADIWTKLAEAEISDLLDETQSGFRFVLGVSNDEKTINNNLINAFRDKCVVEGEVDICWLEPGIPMRELAKVMQSAINAGRPLYLISREADLSLLRQVNELMEVLGG